MNLKEENYQGIPHQITVEDIKINLEIDDNWYGVRIMIQDGGLSMLQKEATALIGRRIRCEDRSQINFGRASCLEILLTMLETNLYHMINGIEEAPAPMAEILIVDNNSFNVIRRKNPPPVWAGAYVLFSKMIIYNAKYIEKVLAGDGYWGNREFNPQVFFEEMRHELLHSYEAQVFFKNNPVMVRYFFSNSAWILEGLKEAIARQDTAMPKEEFYSKLRETRAEYPDFSIEQLSNSGNFWRYSQDPPHHNISYQYSCFFMRELAQLAEKGFRNRGAIPNKPYEGIYRIIDETVRRYQRGHPEPISKTLEDVVDIGPPTLREIEDQLFAKAFDSYPASI